MRVALEAAAAVQHLALAALEALEAAAEAPTPVMPWRLPVLALGKEAVLYQVPLQAAEVVLV